MGKMEMEQERAFLKKAMAGHEMYPQGQVFR